MPRKNGVPRDRADRIVQLLRERGSLSVEEICVGAGVSQITARRDLGDLEDMGLLRRTTGGAVPLEPLLYEPFRYDSTFREQLERSAAEKRHIGWAAAGMVRDGETIACTAGTTTTQVMRCLRHRSDLKLKLVTNGVNIAMELGQLKHLDVFLTGGHMRGDWFSLAGGDAIRTMRQYFVDTAFIGVNGIDPELGLTCFNADEAVLNAVMVEQAKRRIVVADHTKVGVVATHRICPLEAVHLLITDSGASNEEVAPYAARGIEVRRIQVPLDLKTGRPKNRG
jgi:DeoR family transcriptional regulator of aga operon